MRVLMTTDSVGGVWTYCLELVRALREIGIEASVATMGAKLTDQQVGEMIFAGADPLFESEFKLEWMASPWHDLAAAGEWLLDVERQVRPDVLHLNSYVHGTLPWAAPTVMVGHSCVLSWWRAVRSEEAPPEWQRYADEVRAGLRAADFVAAPTRAMLHSLRTTYGPLEHSATIHNCRDSSRFVASNGGPRIFAMGRLWDPAKNLAALDEIAPQLAWPVRVAGSCVHPDSGESVAAQNLTMLGSLSQPQVARELSDAAIYALPARYEPFGLSILEAALSGCALVVGDIPSLRELWEGVAWFVAPDSPDALTDALQRLIDDEPLRAASAEAAFARARRFTPESTARAYARVYHEVIEARRSDTLVPAGVGAQLQELRL